MELAAECRALLCEGHVGVAVHRVERQQQQKHLARGQRQGREAISRGSE